MLETCLDIQKEETCQNKRILKIVAVSDTHGTQFLHKKILNESGDIFIHAGDFTYYGLGQDFDTFLQFLDALNFKHKIVIAGNHQIVLDNGNMPLNLKEQYQKEYPCKYSRQFIVSQIKKRAIYLEHQFVEVEGLKIFGSPYTQYHCGSAFQVKRPVSDMLWDQIPEGLDILITHGPPYQILDLTAKKVNAGCPILLEKIKHLKPKIHLFGHIHQAHGKTFYQGIHFYNVAQRYALIQ